MEVLLCGSQSDAVEMSWKMTRKELFKVLKSEGFLKLSISKCNERLYTYILDKSNVQDVPLNLEKKIRCNIKVFVTKLMAKWKGCHHMQERFFKNQAGWLDEEFKVPQVLEIQQTPNKKKTQGRPRKDFEKSSLRTKQRTVKTLVNQISPEQLSYAAESSLIKIGKRTKAKVMRLALEASPKSLKKMQNVNQQNTFSTYSSEEALALIIDTNLTKEDYIKIQRGAKSRGANIYPAYNSISAIKKSCYPNNITVTESEATNSLQELLELTVHRLCQVQREVISLHLPSEVTQVDIFYKWGLDGSGGHSIYKQNFKNNPNYSDSNIIISTIVPLEISVKHAGSKLIFWKNLSPSSTKYCRPISFKLLKETNENIKQEYDIIEQQIQNLTPTDVSLIEDKHIQFKHLPICTMMDGKTCNVLTDTASSQACNICKVTPKDINDLEKVLARPCNTSAFKFGISILHAYLRCYEFLLHIAYKLELRQWQARGEAAKNVVKERKKTITNLFYEKMGLVVDLPKQGGGNSNDGNTARNFFKNPSTVAEITGLDESIITRFANILSAISSCHYIKLDAYRVYCLETAKLCVQCYGWYNMSASVHKLLIHSSEIIASLPLPVGQLSEDVLEASQKEYKNIRLFHSRKTSRVDTNTDILHWMLINSDPLISSKRHKSQQNRKIFNEDVLSLITIPPFLENVSTDTTGTDNDLTAEDDNDSTTEDELSDNSGSDCDETSSE